MALKYVYLSSGHHTGSLAGLRFSHHHLFLHPDNVKRIRQEKIALPAKQPGQYNPATVYLRHDKEHSGAQCITMT